VTTKVAKSKRPQAERAAEWALRASFGCVATRRALRTKFAKVDFFACDVIGLCSNGVKWWVQVTAGQTAAVLVRRKKIEEYAWHELDCIAVWQLVERADVANPRRKAWFFRVWRYYPHLASWCEDSPIPVLSSWFKAYREDSEAKADIE
jgi:hypothetical protein